MIMGLKFIVNTDACCRGNPGTAAIGVVIHDDRGRILDKYGKPIGKTTNNEAEYKAAISALESIRNMCGEKAKKAAVELRTDSQLVVNQMNGEFKVKRPNIKPLFHELCELKESFSDVIFSHVPREENKEADRLANKALDKTANK